MNLKNVKSVLFVALMVFLFSCKNEELENKIADLENQNTELNNASGEKDDKIENYIQSLNEIYDNLAVIKEKEKIVSSNFNMGNGELNTDIKDLIVNDMGLINNLLEENKQKLAWLQSKLKKSNLKIAELEKMIENMASQLQEKDAEIVSLQTQLANANQQLKVLFEEYNNRIEEIGAQTDKLNTAYYCYGTSKELIAQGVLTKEGGFIGIGKSQKLADDFNKEYFTKVDITLVKSIDLKAKKAKLVTTHASDSYAIEGADGKVDKLVIKNAEKFWGSSKYLVVVVE
ncbi:MAG: hypothetical protein KDD24_03510 [Flavobacteriales bacterium]|nr:hypothetical protein [Flavobacteriales bacterium]MCB9173351.1 hypothetical protein [Flavobacteriales bacterium]